MVGPVKSWRGFRWTAARALRDGLVSGPVVEQVGLVEQDERAPFGRSGLLRAHPEPLPEARQGGLGPVRRRALTHVEVGNGWLIFGLPSAEVAVHPADENGVHELYLLCDDIDAFAAATKARGVACSAVAERGWGRLVSLTLPGGGTLGVYQPRHARPCPPPGANLERAKAYLAALEGGTTGDALARFYSDDVVQEEFPNRLVPTGAHRDLAALLEGAVRGQKVMQRQRYEIVRAYETGDTVVIEVSWIGTLAVPVGSLPAGGEMRARFAVFFEFRDGLIVRQRNYDCFEPW